MLSGESKSRKNCAEDGISFKRNEENHFTFSVKRDIIGMKISEIKIKACDFCSVGGDDKMYAKKPRKDSYEVRVQPKLALVIGWCRRGLSKEQICENLGISVQSFDNYYKRYEDFAQAVDKGREEVEIHIENALVKRALGYSYKEVTRERKLVRNPETGDDEYKLVVTKSVTKHVVPDVGAQQYYLEHRAPKRWERVPQNYLDSNAINKDIMSIADLLNNPVPERKMGDEELDG